MVVDRHEAHTLECRKEGDVRIPSGKGTSLLGVTRSSTVAIINYELLDEALWAGIAPSTHCLLYFRRSDLHKVESANPGAKQQPTTATLG